ncbi:MAG: stage III sporulation protein AF [Ignavibacteriales bacterium]
METLSQIAKNLLLVIMIAGFLEILLPDSSMRSFVRFAVGLFIIMAILNPVLDILYDHRDLQSEAWEMAWEYQDSTSLQQQGIELNKDLQSSSESVLQTKIEQQVKSLAILVPGVDDLETEITLDPQLGQVEKIEMTVKPFAADEGKKSSVQAFASDDISIKDRENIRSKLISMMENFYGLEKKKIVINFEGG